MSQSADGSSNSGSKYTRSRRGSGSAHGARALAECSPALLQSTIVSVLESGDAITLGTTRDGGAVSIALYSDGVVEKLYGASLEELTMLLEDVGAVAEGN